MPIVLLNGTVWKNWHPSSHGQPNRAIAPLLSTSYREPYFSNNCCYWYKWFVPVTGIIGVIRIVSQHVVGAFGYRHIDSVMHDHIPTNRCNTLDKKIPAMAKDNNVSDFKAAFDSYTEDQATSFERRFHRVSRHIAQDKNRAKHNEYKQRRYNRQQTA